MSNRKSRGSRRRRERRSKAWWGVLCAWLCDLTDRGVCSWPGAEFPLVSLQAHRTTESGQVEAKNSSATLPRSLLSVVAS